MNKYDLKRYNRYSKYLFLPVLIVIGLATVFQFAEPEMTVVEAEGAAPVLPTPVVSVEEAFPHVISPRTSLFQILRELEVPAQTIQKIVVASKPIQNLANLKPGIRFRLLREPPSAPDITTIEFRFSAIERLKLTLNNDVWVPEQITEQVELKVVTFSGIVTNSLWESAIKAKMDPNLISELADIFGWEVDFAREVRKNDSWRITVEQKWINGEPYGWGAILAAEYENAGVPHHAVLFRLDGKEMGYFTPGGTSLRKMFLKSPIRYGRITSNFSRRRFHPKLKIFRPHNGVDYGAPIGTPIRAVGDGVVIFAQRSGGGGNVIKIRHNATYQTAYKHLHGYAKGIRNGKRVQQGQVIGYVGNTGLSTGPHLHFEFYHSGNYVDPLSKRFPTAEPVPDVHLTQFKSEAKRLLASLPARAIVDNVAQPTPATP